MLSDAQIERYSRQVILPEIGARGQESLLAASVAVHGRGDACAACAAYLAAAGVGRISLAAADETPSAVGAAFGASRNPDVNIVRTFDDAPQVAIWIGARPPETPPGAAVLWGSASGAALVRVRFPRGRACLGCLGTVAEARGRSMPDASIALGLLVALDALRALLGLGDDSADVVRADLASSRIDLRPLAPEPGCRLAIR